MREIEFRAWHEQRKQMCRVLGLYLFFREADLGIPDVKLTAESNTTESGHTLEDVSFDDIKLMQYTGLQDKHSVDIFEGDILKLHFDTDAIEDWHWLQLSDEEKKTGTKLLEVVDLVEFSRTPLPDKFEVIGNIYEDPELTKVGDA